MVRYFSACCAHADARAPRRPVSDVYHHAAAAILLLTATLWQGTPTSLWKCVFDLTRRSLRHLQLKSQALLVSKDETESGNAFRGRYPN